MKLDKTFENEIKKIANGDNSREYKFAFIKELKKVSASLENRYEFDGAMKKYGRAKIAVCIAATISQNAHRYETEQIQWANTVMSHWTNICGTSMSAAIINIHPGIMEALSRGLRKLTVA
jgi:hypothetical protein